VNSRKLAKRREDEPGEHKGSGQCKTFLGSHDNENSAGRKVGICEAASVSEWDIVNLNFCLFNFLQ
jgi:hypothetical protein